MVIQANGEIQKKEIAQAIEQRFHFLNSIHFYLLQLDLYEEVLMEGFYLLGDVVENDFLFVSLAKRL